MKLRRNVLLIKITNVALIFQHNIEAMLNRLLWKKCIIYIDNIFGATFNKYLTNIQEVLNCSKTIQMQVLPGGN